MMEEHPRHLRVTRLAAEEASQLGHHWIGCEHLLLGMLKSEGSVAKVLVGAGVSYDDVRGRIVRAFEGLEFSDADRMRTRWTPRAGYVLRLMDVECERLQSDGVSEGHLFLALLTERRSFALRMLSEIGVDATAVRRQVLEDLEVPEQTREQYISERDAYDRVRPAGR